MRQVHFKTSILLFCLLPFLAFPQNILEEMANDICECLGEEITDIDLMEARLDTCSASVIVSRLTDSTQTHFQNITTVEEIQLIVFRTKQQLFTICPTVRHTIIMNQRAQFYSPPKSEEALYYYQLGGLHYESEEYAEAIKYFKMADKAEKRKAVTYDYLGLCYFKNNQTDDAIKYFKKSLKYYSDSDIALLHLAKINLNKGNYSLAMNYYEQFQYLYPESPEGYFGLAQLNLHYNNPEIAAEWGLIAYTIYEQQHAENLEACGKLLREIYIELEKIHKSFVIKKFIKDYQLEFQSEPWLETQKFKN